MPRRGARDDCLRPEPFRQTWNRDRAFGAGWKCHSSVSAIEGGGRWVVGHDRRTYGFGLGHRTPASAGAQSQAPPMRPTTVRRGANCFNGDSVRRPCLRVRRLYHARLDPTCCPLTAVSAAFACMPPATKSASQATRRECGRRTGTEAEEGRRVACRACAFAGDVSARMTGGRSGSGATSLSTGPLAPAEAGGLSSIAPAD